MSGEHSHFGYAPLPMAQTLGGLISVDRDGQIVRLWDFTLALGVPPSLVVAPSLRLSPQ